MLSGLRRGCCSYSSYGYRCLGTRRPSSSRGLDRRSVQSVWFVLAMHGACLHCMYTTSDLVHVYCSEIAYYHGIVSAVSRASVFHSTHTRVATEIYRILHTWMTQAADEGSRFSDNPAPLPTIPQTP